MKKLLLLLLSIVPAMARVSEKEIQEAWGAVMLLGVVMFFFLFFYWVHVSRKRAAHFAALTEEQKEEWAQEYKEPATEKNAAKKDRALFEKKKANGYYNDKDLTTNNDGSQHSTNVESMEDFANVECQERRAAEIDSQVKKDIDCQIKEAKENGSSATKVGIFFFAATIISIVIVEYFKK